MSEPGAPLETIRLPPQMWAFISAQFALNKCMSCCDSSQIPTIYRGSYLNATSLAQSVSTTLRPVWVPFSGTCASHVATTSLPSSCTEILPESLSAQRRLTENGSLTALASSFPAPFRASSSRCRAASPRSRTRGRTSRGRSSRRPSCGTSVSYMAHNM
jgi:hypothetical protein